MSPRGRQGVNRRKTGCLPEGEGFLQEEDKVSTGGRQSVSQGVTSCLPELDQVSPKGSQGCQRKGDMVSPRGRQFVS